MAHESDVGAPFERDGRGKLSKRSIINPSADLSGAQGSHNLIVTPHTGAPAGQAEIFDSAGGIKVFTAMIDNTVTLAAGEFIAIGYGTVVSDAGIVTNVKNYALDILTPTGAAFTGVWKLDNDHPVVTIPWDGGENVNLIRRVVAVTNAIADRQMVLVTVA